MTMLSPSITMCQAFFGCLEKAMTRLLMHPLTVLPSFDTNALCFEDERWIRWSVPDSLITFLSSLKVATALMLPAGGFRAPEVHGPFLAHFLASVAGYQTFDVRPSTGKP